MITLLISLRLTKGVDSEKDVLERLKDLEEEKKNVEIVKVNQPYSG